MSFTVISLTNGEGWYIVYYSLAKADLSPGLAKCLFNDRHADKFSILPSQTKNYMNIMLSLKIKAR